MLFPNGSQMVLAGDRDDCNAEAAMSAGMRSVLEKLPGGNATAAAHYATIAKGLLEYVFTLSGTSTEKGKLPSSGPDRSVVSRCCCCSPQGRRSTAPICRAATSRATRRWAQKNARTAAAPRPARAFPARTPTKTSVGLIVARMRHVPSLSERLVAFRL